MKLEATLPPSADADSGFPQEHAPETRAAATFLDKVFDQYDGEDFAVRFWDGTLWQRGQNPRFTLLLENPGALRAMFQDPSERNLGEAYIYGDFDIEGDVFAAVELGDHLVDRVRKTSELFRFGMLLRKLPRPACGRSIRGGPALVGAVHSKQRDQGAIRYHYDVPADFYKLWLDSRMVYSCAYFHRPEEDLETAQINKLDYICRKLRLQPGERLLDIGCGWGALVLYAAARYGVQALGITLSPSQAEFANARVREAGLASRCQVEVRDYRDVNSPEGYDKLVSVGMFEHVGEKLLTTYFVNAWQNLRPGGVFLNHGIGRSRDKGDHGKEKHGDSFATRYVFPDGELVPISTTLHAAETAGFEVRDVESLGEHYSLTLRQWVRRLEAHAEEARRVTDDVKFRIWRLYMAGYARQFETGKLTVYQTLLAKPTAGSGSKLPLTREDWYGSGG